MKNAILGSAFLAALMAFAACSGGASKDESKDSAPMTTAPDSATMVSAVKYTCTMHPQIISDTAGHCPICGMTMVPVKDSMHMISKDSMMK